MLALAFGYGVTAADALLLSWNERRLSWSWQVFSRHVATDLTERIWQPGSNFSPAAACALRNYQSRCCLLR